MPRRRYNPGMTTSNIIVSNLRALRKDGAFTVAELAERTGIHRVQVSRILNGHQESLSIDQAVAIAAAVNVPLAELMAPSISASHA